MDKSTLSPSEGGKKGNTTCTILIGVAVAVLVCGAAAFALGALFYRPQILSLGSTATPTKTPEAVATSSPATDTPLPPTDLPPATDIPVPDPPTAESPPTDTPEPPTPALSPTKGPIPTPRPPKPLRMSSPEYGMQAFLWWRAETAHRDLGLIRDAGFTWVKQVFPWREIEGSAKGTFDWDRPDRIVAQVEEFGLDLVVRIDSQPAWAGGDFPQNGPPDNLQDLAETAHRDLGLIRDAGFTWVKQVFPWREIEGSAKGQFDWERPDRIVAQVEEFGLDLVARIDSQPAWVGGGFPQNGPPDNLQDLADFLYAMASRYKGRIRAYQIYNEPNLNVAGRSEWGGRPPNPAEYTALLKVAYQAIKQADPNAMVISAGLSPTSRWDDQAMPDEEFLKGMYAAGAKPYFDVLGAHGAGYKVPPETDPAVVAKDPVLNNNDPSPEERKRIYCFRHVEDLRRIMVENGDGNKQIALLEFGWTSDSIHPEYSWFSVTEEKKGDYLIQAYKYAKENWSPWIGLMSLIYVADPDWIEDHEQYWWAITYPDYPVPRWRPAYIAVKNMPK